MNLLASPIAVASVSFLLAAVTTMVLVPQVRRMGLRFGWTDQPDERKQHVTPMVRLGALPWCWALERLWRRSGLWGASACLAPAKDQLIWSNPGRFALLFFDWPGGRPLRSLPLAAAGWTGCRGLCGLEPGRSNWSDRSSLVHRFSWSDCSAGQPQPAGHCCLAGGNHQRHQLA